MYRITIIKNGIVQSVQFNNSAEQGESNARMEYGDSCKYIVEPVEDQQ